MSLTSYRAAPPRDQGFSLWLKKCPAQEVSERPDAVAEPIAGQFGVFQINAMFDLFVRPIGAREGEIGRARVKLNLRRVMLKTQQRPARMIPGGDQNYAVDVFRTEQLDGK